MPNRTNMKVLTVALVTALALFIGAHRVEAGEKKASARIKLAGFGAHLFCEPLGKVDPRDLLERHAPAR